jgi:hypothetical protein
MKRLRLYEYRQAKREKTKKHLPLYAGRPERDKEIANDDLLNLRIALNTARSLDEFLDMV